MKRLHVRTSHLGARVALCYCLVLATLACGVHKPIQPVEATPDSAGQLYVKKRSSGFGGEQPRVDHLARGLLYPDRPPLPGFAYYLYLVFADRSDSMRPHRLAAASAFLATLDSVEQVGGRFQTDPGRTAVSLVPVKSREAGNALLKAPSKDTLERDYDYALGRRMYEHLLRRFGRFPRVAIVGSPIAFRLQQGFDGQEVSWKALCGDPLEVERTYQRFESRLLVEEGTMVRVLEAMRTVFESVGGFVEGVTGAEPAPGCY